VTTAERWAGLYKLEGGRRSVGVGVLCPNAVLDLIFGCWLLTPVPIAKASVGQEWFVFLLDDCFPGMARLSLARYQGVCRVVWSMVCFSFQRLPVSAFAPDYEACNTVYTTIKCFFEVESFPPMSVD